MNLWSRFPCLTLPWNWVVLLFHAIPFSLSMGLNGAYLACRPVLLLHGIEQCYSCMQFHSMVIEGASTICRLFLTSSDPGQHSFLLPHVHHNSHGCCFHSLIDIISPQFNVLESSGNSIFLEFRTLVVSLSRQCYPRILMDTILAYNYTFAIRRNQIWLTLLMTSSALCPPPIFKTTVFLHLHILAFRQSSAHSTRTDMDRSFLNVHIRVHKIQQAIHQ